MDRAPLLRRAATALAISLLGLAVVACNTVEGAGKDMKSAGSAISTAAQ